MLSGGLAAVYPVVIVGRYRRSYAADHICRRWEELRRKSWRRIENVASCFAAVAAFFNEGIIIGLK